MTFTPMPRVVGLLCGSGLLPVRVAEALRRRGVRVVAVAIKGEASESVEDAADETVWTGIAKLGRWIRVFKKAGAQVVLMAGGIGKEAMYASRMSLMPDWRSARIMLKQVANRGDHTILAAVADEFGAEGMPVGSVVDYCPDLLFQAGCLTESKPDDAQWADIRYAWPLIKQIASMQIGQTIVVKNKAVVAVESIDGTDETLKRGGRLARGGAVAVKVAKEGHDMRFDIPSIGPSTVDTLVQSEVSVMAVEAGFTILLDPDEVKRRATSAGVCILAVEAAEMGYPEGP